MADEHLGTPSIFREPVARHGDLFPLPVPCDVNGFAGSLGSLGSRRARQRVQRRRLFEDRQRGTLWALNHLAGFDDERLWPNSSLNQAQSSVLQRVKELHVQRPPPPQKLSPQAALRQLLLKKAGSPYSSDGVLPGQMASYVRERVSLPRDQLEPIPLEALLPEVERDRLLDFRNQMLLSDEEIAGVLERGLVGDRYMDPRLEGGGKVYHDFVADLIESKLVSFTTSPRVQVGAFVVTKKGEKQRLIIDARRANKLFRSPPTTVLGSMDSWARLGCDAGSDLFVAQEDVKDYFYRLRIPKDLGEFFALPKVDPALLKERLGYLPMDLQELLDVSEAPIYPHMIVLPMGFAWAFHLAHVAHVELTRRTLPNAMIAQDKRPAPVMGAKVGQCQQACLVYADNGNHLGVSREAVRNDQVRMMDALHAHGLATHDLVESSNLCESLGVRIDGLGGCVQTTPLRDHRLDQALLARSSSMRVSGEELQVVVGRLTMRALLHRGLLSVLRHVYVFIEQNYTKRTKLWPSVRRELEMFRCLMVLGYSNLRAPWHDEIFCTDACLSGYAVMKRSLDTDIARQVGAEDERWRFFRGAGPKLAPRQAALAGADVFSDVCTVRPMVDGEVIGDWEVDPNFPEVLRSLLHPEDWGRVWSAPFTFKEPVHLLEGRSILATVKHVSRDARVHGSHVLILNDNMGVVLATQKGRCSSFALLRILRRTLAYSLACGIRVHVRWVASELNVADEDSRQWEPRPFKQHRETAREGPEKKGHSLYERGGQNGQQTVPQSSSPRCGGVQPPQSESFEATGGTLWKASRPSFEGTSSECREEEEEGSREGEKVWATPAGNARVEDCAGVGEREGGHEKGLRDEARQVLRVRGLLSSPHCWREGPRRSAVRLCGPPVLEWRRFQLWAEAAGSAGVLEARGRTRGESKAPALQKGVERMAPHGAYPNQSAVSGLLIWRGRKDMALYNELTFSTYLRPGEALKLKAADFVPQSGAPEGYPHSILVLAPFERGESSKTGIFDEVVILDDTRVPWMEQVLKTHVRACVQQQGEDSDLWSFNARQFLLEWRKAVEVLQVGCACSPYQNRHGGASRDHLLHLKSVQGIQRRGRWAVDSSARIYDKPGRLAQMVSRHTRLSPFGEKVCSLPGLLPEWHLPAASRPPKESQGDLQGQALLSLFGGASEVAKAFSRRGGCAAVLDVAYSSVNDLSRMSAWTSIAKSVSCFDAVGIDIPCNTWSRARRAPKGSRMPQALRGDDPESIFGLQELNERDQEKVRRANNMLFGACKVIRKCLRLGKCGYLENPLSSRIWKTPQLQRLLQDHRVQFVKTHLCMYGTQWKKPTGILFWNCQAAQLLKCQGKFACSRTSKPHVQLTGVKGNKFLTELAQVYPRLFAEDLVKQLR